MKNSNNKLKIKITKEDILNHLIHSIDQECPHPSTLARKIDIENLLSQIGFLEGKTLLNIRICMSNRYRQLYHKYLGKQYDQEFLIYRNIKFPFFEIPVYVLCKDKLQDFIRKRVPLIRNRSYY